MFDQRSKNGTVYDLTGPENAPVVALIHGLGLCKELWVDYIASLSERYRVLNYDLYGHGKSAAVPETASLRVYAKQLLELLDELKIDKAAIIGFSIGGMINRRFAIDFPQRVSALAILNSPHDRGEQAQQEVEQRAKQVADQGATATLEAALARWFTSDFRQSHPQVMDKVRAWRELVDVPSYAQAAWVLAHGVRELTRDSLPISAPAMVLTCENDSGSTPAMSEMIQKQLPELQRSGANSTEIIGAELTIVPRLQHLGLLQEPEAFLSILNQFLQRSL